MRELCSRAPGISGERQEDARPEVLMGTARATEPRPHDVCRALVTGNHMWCHFQLLRETDAPRSISLPIFKEVL